jgi:hypothetical protein
MNTSKFQSTKEGEKTLRERKGKQLKEKEEKGVEEGRREKKRTTRDVR